MQRVIAYIDGYNLYNGLKEKAFPVEHWDAPWPRYYWLNVVALMQRYLKQEQELVMTKYFTTRVAEPADRVKRQSIFLDVLAELPALKIIEGQYQKKKYVCHKCHWVSELPNEKMTDVNIAVELIRDAYCNAFDIAFLVSGDSDLTAPVLAIRELFPAKPVICIFPPRRFSAHLAKPHIATGYLRIHERDVKKCMFPDKITLKSGFEVQNPWPR